MRVLRLIEGEAMVTLEVPLSALRMIVAALADAPAVASDADTCDAYWDLDYIYNEVCAMLPVEGRSQP